MAVRPIEITVVANKLKAAVDAALRYGLLFDSDFRIYYDSIDTNPKRNPNGSVGIYFTYFIEPDSDKPPTWSPILSLGFIYEQPVRVLETVLKYHVERFLTGKA